MNIIHITISSLPPPLPLVSLTHCRSERKTFCLMCLLLVHFNLSIADSIKQLNKHFNYLMFL